MRRTLFPILGIEIVFRVVSHDIYLYLSVKGKDKEVTQLL